MTPQPIDLSAVPFQGKDPSEKFQFYFRQHWMRMLWPIARMMLLTLLWVIICAALLSQTSDSSAGRHGTIVFLMAFLILIQWNFLQRFYRHFLYVIVVTDKKIHRIKKNLLSMDNHESLDLWTLQDIQKSQRGVMQNMLGFGTITLEARENEMRLHFTPRITKHYQDVMGLRERARMLGLGNAGNQARRDQTTP